MIQEKAEVSVVPYGVRWMELVTYLGARRRVVVAVRRHVGEFHGGDRKR